MRTLAGRAAEQQWWKTMTSILVLGLLVTASFCLTHCGHDDGMSPDQCAKLLLLPGLAVFAAPVASGWVARWRLAPLYATTLDLRDLPPEPARS